MPKKSLLFVTSLLIATSAFAFGSGSRAEKTKITIASGVDSIGVHFGGDDEGDISFECPKNSTWVADSFACICNDGYVMKKGACVESGDDPTPGPDPEPEPGPGPTPTNPCEDFVPTACALSCDEQTGIDYKDVGAECDEHRICDANYDCICDTTNSWYEGLDGCIFCDPELHLEYDERTKTCVCAAGYAYLEYNPACVEVIGDCSRNSDCADGQYCDLSASESTGTGLSEVPTVGECKTLDEGTWTPVETVEDENGHSYAAQAFLRSGSAMQWWAANNWCHAHNMQLVMLSDLYLDQKTLGDNFGSKASCSGTSTSACTGDIDWATLKSSVVGTAQVWTREYFDYEYYDSDKSGRVLAVNASNKYVGSSSSGRRANSKALCKSFQ